MAHLLAKFGLSLSFELVWVEDYPYFISQVVNSELCYEHNAFVLPLKIKEK